MENRASKTAADVLIARAISSVSPANRRILYDPYAVEFLSAPWSRFKVFLRPQEQNLVYHVGTMIADIVMGFRASVSVVALRHRHIDDRMYAAYKSGIRQVIILGAGYDSRAHRTYYRDMTFVEIDHPETQHVKLKLLQQARGSFNKSVDYLPVDFLQDWEKEIIDSRLVRNQPSFVIWEGVSNYLPESAVMYTLDAISRFCHPGSIFIFDAYVRDIANGGSHNRLMRSLYDYGRDSGEPFLWGCDREYFSKLLEPHGYKNTLICSLKDIAERLRLEAGLVIPDAPVHSYMYLAEAEL